MKTPLLLLLLCAAAPPSELTTYQRAVAGTMREPEAVQFRDTRIAPQRDGRHAICGYLNTKNGYGGYSGFMHFSALILPDRTLVYLSGNSEEATSYSLYYCNQQ